MPIEVRVEAGAEPDPEQTEEGLAEAVEVAQTAVAEFQELRAEIRATTPKPDLLSALGDTDDDALAAVDALAAAEKAYGRFTRGGSAGQVVPVGTARESEG